MFKLDITKTKNMQFEVSIQGVNYTNLKGSLKFEIDNIQYGFPLEISENIINVDIPPLLNVIKKELKNGDIVKCNLEVYGDGFFLTPWENKFSIQVPKKVLVKVKENINEEENGDSPKVKVIKPIEDIDVKKQTNIEPDITEQTNEEYQNRVDKLVSSKVDEMFNAINKGKKKKKIVSENKKSVSKKKIIKEITKEEKQIVSKDKDYDLKKLMESVGMKNERIQKIMLEKVSGMASEPEDRFVALQSLLGLRMYNPQMEKIMKKFSGEK